jgi:hypothetical protein
MISIRSVARWLVFPGCTPYLLRQTDVELSVRLRKRLERGYSRVLALIHVIPPKFAFFCLVVSPWRKLA